MKNESRPARWARLVSEAQDELADVKAAWETLDSSLCNLRALQEEYQEWSENLPENLQGSPVAEKLDAIMDMDDPEELSRNMEDEMEAVEQMLDVAEEMDLPRGFGRD